MLGVQAAGRAERVLAADRDQAVEPELAHRRRDRRRAVVALERVRSRGAEDRAASREDPPRRLDRQLLVIALERTRASHHGNRRSRSPCMPIPLRMIARMTALRPGQSPPPVRTPKRTRPRYPPGSRVTQRPSRSRRPPRKLAAALVRILCRDKLGVRKLRAREARGVPDLAVRALAPRRYVEIRLRVLLVAGRYAIRRSAAGVVAARIKRDVEVLRPEDHRRRLVADGGCRTLRLERARRERVELAQPRSRLRVEVERRVVGGNAVEEQAARPRSPRRRRATRSSCRRSAPSSETTISTPSMRT